MTMTYGTVSWIDLGIPGTARAAAFYGALFGWDIADADGSGYRVASVHGHPVAGLGPAEDPGAPYWTVYVAVADIAAAARACSAAGGTVIAEPAAAGDLGSFAVTADPMGAPLTLWQPREHPGTHRSGGHGTLAGVTLRTGQPAESGRYLGRVLGWQLNQDGTLARDGHTVARWQSLPAGPQAPHSASWVVAFAVDDVTDAIERACALGARPSALGPAVLTDPCGALFGLVAT